MKNIEALRNKRDDIINCEVKDSSGLNDFQKTPNDIPIMIPKVGIERFRIPLRFEHSDGTIMSHDTEASMFVLIEAHKTGANMSRFCKILQDESASEVVNHDFFKNILRKYRTDLRDYEDEDLIPESYLKLKFNYPVKQPSLKSGMKGSLSQPSPGGTTSTCPAKFR